MSEQLEALKEAKAHILALEAELDRLMSPPFSIGTVLKPLTEGAMLVSAGGGPVIVSLPWVGEGTEKVAKLWPSTKRKKLMPGALITFNGAGAIVDVLDIQLPGGEATVKRLFEGEMMEVEGGLSGGAVLVFKGDTCPKPGDTVQMDRSGQIAMKIIPKDVRAYSVETSTGVEWNDIGGQEDAKAALREAVEGPVLNAALFKAYGKKPLKGVLLSGPPGCGKTLLAKATANAIRESHGKDESNTAFIYVKGPEVLSMWVGNTEAQIRGLFARAKEHRDTYGYPAVIFIDEADAILGKRGTSHGSVLASTVVPTFLAEMDGMADSGAFILLATNRQDILDPAIVREGRIDRKVRVDRPKLTDAAKILRIHLGKTKVADDPDAVAGAAAAELFSDTHLLYRVGLKGKGMQPFYVRSLISGAMLAGVVDMATSIAIARDASASKPKASGVKTDDIVAAVNRVVNANRNLNHDDDLMLFAEQHGAEIEAVQRIAA